MRDLQITEPSAAMQRRADAAGCILFKTDTMIGGWMLFDNRKGHYVFGHPGYPLEMWADDQLTPGFSLWDAVEARAGELGRARKGVDPLDSYRFTCLEDWTVAVKNLRDKTQLTAAIFHRASVTVPDPYRGDMLWAWHKAGCDPEMVSAEVGPLWSSLEYPDKVLSHQRWRTLFAVAGFTRNGRQEKRRSTPIQLWRGAVPQRRTDWSWTTDPAVAHTFAHEGKGARPRNGKLWTALVPPEHLYAENTDRGESEWVAEVPAGLIREDTDYCTCPETR